MADQPTSVDKTQPTWWRTMGRLPSAEPETDAQVRASRRTEKVEGKRVNGCVAARRRGCEEANKTKSARV